MVNQNKKVQMRKIDDLVIMFYDKRTIYVKHHYGFTCYNRWWIKERGYSTTKWQPFSEALMRRRKHLTWGELNALAERYEIIVNGANGFPEVKEEDIKWLK